MKRPRLYHSSSLPLTVAYGSSYFLKCYVETCPWYFRASTIHNTSLFKIRAFDNIHTCTVAERGFTQRQANTKMVAALAMEQLRNHKRKHTPNNIKDDLLLTIGVEISYNKAWRAKEYALKTLYGNPSDGYKQLPKYLYVLGDRYPGSYLKYHKGDMNEFMYLFVALSVSIGGFVHCRPIVVVDGSHLKGPYMGTFISAGTLDGAGNILPLAYGVVDSENDASWTWFFEQFKAAFGVRPDMAIVSDRNESIWNSVRIVFPGVHHYACMWHVWKNVCKNYKRCQDTLSSLYYQMAKCYSRTEFETLMTQVERTDPRVKAYLVDVGYEKWARSFAPTNRGRMTTSNIAECINACLVEERKLPILEFLEKVRELFAKWNRVNGEKARYMAASRLGDTFQDIMMMNEFKSSKMTVVKSSEYIYAVNDRGTRNVVYLNTKTCTCAKFQYDEIPCEHAMAVLRSKGIKDMMPYCSHYYKKETLERVYMHAFPPMPLRNEWYAPSKVLEELLLPPTYRRPPGRPRVVRVKSKNETFKSSTNCCGKCGRAGHNRRSCKFFPSEV